MTSSKSEAGPALKVDGIRGLPEMPSTLQHFLFLCEHRGCFQKHNQEAPIQASGILLLLRLQVLNLMI